MRPNLTRAILGILLLVPIISGAGAEAQEVMRIAAVVNDEVISGYDLTGRLSLVIAQSRLQNRPEIRRRLAPQVLRILIDEKVKLQEAKRLSIEVSKGDIEQALRQIEIRNELPKGGLDDFLARIGVDKLFLIGQIEAEIAWVRVVTRQLRSSIEISDREVDEAVARMEADKGKPEFLASEILLPIDDPGQVEELRLLAERLIQQLREGADFPALARSFSKGISASQGGDLGWVRQGRLSDELDSVLSEMKEGELAGPIRSIVGYHILWLRDRRAARDAASGGPGPSVTLTLGQLFLPVATDADETERNVRQEMVMDLAAKAGDCDGMERTARELSLEMSGKLSNVKLNQLPSDLRAVVDGLQLNTPSQPLLREDGYLVLMVCERHEEQTQKVEIDERQNVHRALLNERLDDAGRRYFRDLLRIALVDIRI